MSARREFLFGIAAAAMAKRADRIDIQVEVPGLRYQELASKDAGEPSNIIRERVNKARKIQLPRFEKSRIHSNAQMGTREIKRYCSVKEDAEKLLEKFSLPVILDSPHNHVPLTVLSSCCEPAIK